jgi:prepilin-type N-terminal cleavage/methylation domain-containing protein
MIDMWIRNGNRGGFSLLEIIISMGLIAIALLAVFRLQAQNVELLSDARFMTVATYLAQDRISRILSQDRLGADSKSDAFGEDYPSFRYREEISEVEDFENLFKVTVTIMENETSGIRDLSVETYVYRQK